MIQNINYLETLASRCNKYLKSFKFRLINFASIEKIFASCYLFIYLDLKFFRRKTSRLTLSGSPSPSLDQSNVMPNGLTYETENGLTS